MRLAVEQGDAHVHQGVARRHPAGGLAAHALLDGGDELPGHRSADDLVDEFDAAAGRQRLDLDLADRELAVPAGLFDVAAAPGGLGAEGLAQAHLVRHGVHLHPVAGAQPFQGEVLVGLAQAPQDELVGVRVLLQPHGGVLGDQPRQALGELVLVGLAVGLDGEGEQRVGHGPGLHQERVVLGGEGVARLGAGEFGHAGEIMRRCTG